MAGPFIACSDPPARPTPLPDITPILAIEPRVESVRIEGPEILPIGEAVQFTFIATMTDGTERNLTTEANWVASDEHVISLDAPGLVTGRKGGQTKILAAVQGHARAKFVIALPKGTHRLVGFVRDRRRPTVGRRYRRGHERRRGWPGRDHRLHWLLRVVWRRG